MSPDDTRRMVEKNEQEFESFDYVSLMALVGEVNAPPGGLSALRELVGLWPKSMRRGIDVGCNTGAYTIELAELSGAQILGVDLSDRMIDAARRRLAGLQFSPAVGFALGDATSLQFQTGEFDFVFSGGSTAFVQDRHKAAREYARVVRQGGVVSELNFFYERRPPSILQKRLCHALGFEMPVWSKEDWLDIFRSAGLEELVTFARPAQSALAGDSAAYVDELVKSSEVGSHLEKKLKHRLQSIFDVFIENNEYLGVLGSVFRKPLFSGSPRLFF